ncbi:MAG TPA: hypothetical protein VJ878_02945, partial [Candidatus Izemoplasmatales bacterium]|nr:hypothetical protein [Candidatus Izemoplasmatales bacterium]
HIRFSKPIDFYIDIRGESYAEIFVDAYYDPFYFLYHYQLEMLDTIPLYHQKNTGHFNNIYQALSAELYLPEEDKIVPFMKHNTGKLTYGIGNPNMDGYNSLADYYIKDNIIEIRIPWLLLNISDPSTKQRLGDFYENDWFVSESMPSIWFGGDFIQEDGEVTIDLYETTWQSWHTPTYHMRLKKSYALVQAGFLNYLEE